MSTADSASVRAAELPRWDHCPICDLLVQAGSWNGGVYVDYPKVNLDDHCQKAHGFEPWRMIGDNPFDSYPDPIVSAMGDAEFREHIVAEYVRLIMAGEL